MAVKISSGTPWFFRAMRSLALGLKVVVEFWMKALITDGSTFASTILTTSVTAGEEMMMVFGGEVLLSGVVAWVTGPPLTGIMAVAPSAKVIARVPVRT